MLLRRHSTIVFQPCRPYKNGIRHRSTRILNVGLGLFLNSNRFRLTLVTFSCRVRVIISFLKLYIDRLLLCAQVVSQASKDVMDAMKESASTARNANVPTSGQTESLANECKEALTQTYKGVPDVEPLSLLSKSSIFFFFLSQQGT